MRQAALGHRAAADAAGATSTIPTVRIEGVCGIGGDREDKLPSARRIRSQRRARCSQAALPACDVEVLLQTSKGGRTIVAAARFDTRILKYRPHVVITDLTVCDLRGVSSSLDAYRLQAGWETLLRKLLSVPRSLSDTAGAADQGSPAIVHLESWDRFSPMGGCRNASGRIHHEVSVFYRVPARPHARRAARACGPPARTHRGGLHRATGPERSALAARVPGAQETLRSLPTAVEPTALGRSPACRWSHSCWACARTTPPPHPRATGSPAAPTVRGRTGGVRAHPEP